MYLPYIFAGVVAVNALECFAYVHGWFPTPAKDSETSPSSIPEGSNWHWYKLRSIIKDIYDQGSSYRGVSQRSDHSDVLNTEHKTVLQQTLALLWQFSPDLLVICAGVQLANTFKGLRNTDYSNQVTVELFSLPLTFLVLIIIGIMQYGNSRLNFSRFVFANPIMGLLGYCSFAIYLFQRIIIDWYVREYFGPGFNFTALWQRFIIVLIVILFSWLVQHFVVDTMSVFLFKRMMKYNK